jgi:uncharacterized protein (TIGR02599 family)
VAQITQAATPTPVLAENIIALIVLPERTHNDFLLAPNFHYDSRDVTNRLTLHQLPACLRLALIVVDEASAQILAGTNGTNAPVLIPEGLFQQAAQVDDDLALLEQTLTVQKIRHRIIEREIQVTSSAWSDTPSP